MLHLTTTRALLCAAITVGCTLLTASPPAIGAVVDATKATTADVATEPVTDAESGESDDALKWMRVVNTPKKSIELQVAVRTYVPVEGDGPTVGLVGVAHIGMPQFYRQLQDVLAGYDVVLYESVKPTGAGGAGGETDAERIASTQTALEFVAGLAAAHHARTERFPESLDALRAFSSEVDPRMPQFLDAALQDAWGHTVLYVTAGSEEDPHGVHHVRIVSYGADGKPGGEGVDADLRAEPDLRAAGADEGDNIQQQLADALRMDFQLDAMDYSLPNWRCSDMAIDQVQRSMEKYGVDFTMFGDTLAGTSLPAKLAGILLNMIRMADTLFGGAVVDSITVVMIEMLGSDAALEISMDQFGEGFEAVIVGERNQVTMDDLAAIIRDEPDVDSVAIFYGAAHMPDFHQRLADQLNYMPADEDPTWLRVMMVDYETSAVTPSDVRQLRAMVKWSLARQMPKKDT
jgi:hypothetical protein